MSQQTSIRRGREGWSQPETRALWEEARRCAEDGKPLRIAFDSTAQKTGRKPNSIRNHYYASLKLEEAPEDLRVKRAAPFVPFTDNEVDGLLRAVLTAQAQGQSVRSCVLSLARGDRSMALRLQNKYRSLLRSQPGRVRQMAASLQAEGLHANPYHRPRLLPCRPQSSANAETPCLADALRGADGETATALLNVLADLLEKEGYC